jgi:hypothetical protein
MPDRIIRASILASDRVNQLTWGAEVFYRRLMSEADDFGRYDGRTAILRAKLYPLKLDRVSESDIDKWKAECAQADLVRFYSVDGKPYLEILRFQQRTRAQLSKFPAPPSSADICQQAPADVSQPSAPRGHLRTYSDSETKSETDSLSCSEPPATAAASEPSVIVFSVVGDPKTWGLTQSKIDEYRQTFPHLNVLGECTKAAQWCRDNTAKRKTARGMPKFLFGWLERAQNRAGGDAPPGQREVVRLGVNVTKPDLFGGSES